MRLPYLEDIKGLLKKAGCGILGETGFTHADAFPDNTFEVDHPGGYYPGI